MSDIDEPLSPAGVLRREQIRRLARRAAAARRWRRRAGQAVVVAAVLATAAALLWPHRPAPPVSPQPPAVVARRPDPVSAPPPVTSVVAYVATDPTITDRWSVGPSPPRWAVIGDRELLDTLAAAGRPAGLMTVDGHERLLFRDASPR